MIRLFRNLLTSIPLAGQLLLLIFAIGFPLAALGHFTQTFELYAWLGLSPERVWEGQLWRVLSYGFLAANAVDWILGLFWLATLVSILGRNWSGLEFWVYCLLGVLGGALPIVLLKSGYAIGSTAMVFALLVAWDRFYRNERLILLGLGEIAVRQAAILIALINSVVLLFCCGWFIMVSMWCGGVAGWLYLTVRSKSLRGKPARQIRSERVARLEL